MSEWSSFQVEIIVRIYHMSEFQQDVIQHENYTTFCIQFKKKSVFLKIFCFQADINVKKIIMFLLNTKHIQNLQEFYILEIFPRSDNLFHSQ